MKNFVEAIENYFINKYGFENSLTLTACKMTDLLRKMFNLYEF